jgi:hypothetical protein
MQLSVAAEMSYTDVARMSHNERKILVDVLQEKADAQNPKKKRQQYL